MSSEKKAIEAIKSQADCGWGEWKERQKKYWHELKMITGKRGNTSCVREFKKSINLQPLGTAQTI